MQYIKTFQDMTPLMFHSIGCENYDFWSRSFLSSPVKSFDKFCAYLKSNNFKTIFLKEWYDLKKNTSKNSDDKYVVLTFDDGYLDNWVYVYPILKKYDLKGTIFVNPEFVDTQNTQPRPGYDESSFDVHNVKNILGFLNWEEMRKMESSGTIEIQDHSMSHNKYFSGPNLKDILDDTNTGLYDWLLWYKNPGLKPFYMYEKLFEHVHKGTPVFENGRSLAVRRYFPDENLVEEMINMYTDYVNNNKSRTRAETVSYIKEQYSKLLIGKYNSGRYETDIEMMQRYKYELEQSREIFKRELGKVKDFLCWPGGEYNDFSLQLSKALGYKASNFYNPPHQSSYRKVKDTLLEVIKSPKLKPGITKNDEHGYYRRLERYGITDNVLVAGKQVYFKSDNALIDKFSAINSKLSKSKIILKRVYYYLKQS